jgi:HlyD family secretion protein
VPLERGDLTPMMSAPGMIHAEDEIVLRASEDGTVRSLLGPGDGVVRAGQPIVVLDGAPFQAALAGAGASRAAAQAALVAAQAQLDNARARLDRYENVWRRSQGRVPSANEMDGARAEMMRAVAGLDSAKAASPSRRNRKSRPAPGSMRPSCARRSTGWSSPARWRPARSCAPAPRC